MSNPSPDMGAAAVTERLRTVSRLSDLSYGRGSEGKVDMSAAAVTARLREVSALRALCLRLSALGRAATLHARDL